MGEAVIAVGVDTHRSATTRWRSIRSDKLLGELAFPATAAGYAELQRWAERRG
jgi:hypothetical protein